MKIVHVTNYQVPGYGYEELPLAKAQARLGNDVSIVTSNYLHPRGAYSVLSERFPQRRVRPREELQDGVRIYRMPSIEVGTRPWIRGLGRQLTVLKPDVIHCHNLIVFHPTRIALMKLTGRSASALLVDDHTLYSFVRRGLRARIFYLGYRTVWHQIIAKGIDKICAVTEETAHYLANRCGVRGVIDLMPLGVDIDSFHESGDSRRHWRQKLGLSEHELVYLYTGKIVEPKGVHLLVHASLKLLAEGARFRVVIVGDGDAAYVARMRAEINLADQVERFIFVPSQTQDQLPGLYSAADVAVWPGWESMAIFEAMATSLPVIVNEHSGYSRLVANCGLTFVPDDFASLSRAMSDLTVRARRAELGLAGRALVEGGYSWNDSAARYLAVYASLVRKQLSVRVGGLKDA
jgi:glycosyltransferase involved in cell wall biosynthesis